MPQSEARVLRTCLVSSFDKIFVAVAMEVQNVSANQRPGRSPLLTDWQKKPTNLVEKDKNLYPAKFH